MKELEDFVVLKSLRIHRLEIKPKRVSATYEITRQDGSTAATLLFYTYNHGLFDAKNPADRNLAAMMVAQVALNYGLFCETLILEGPYDEKDRDFIRRMVENTSREVHLAFYF